MATPAESIITVDGRRCTRVRRSNPTFLASFTSPADTNPTPSTTSLGVSGQAEQSNLPGVDGTFIFKSLLPSQTSESTVSITSPPRLDSGRPILKLYESSGSLAGLYYNAETLSTLPITTTAMAGGASGSASPIEGVADNGEAGSRPSMPVGVLIGVVIASVVIAIVAFITIFIFCRGRTKARGGVDEKRVFNLDGSSPPRNPNASPSAFAKTTVSLRQSFAFLMTRLKIRKIRREQDSERGGQGSRGVGDPLEAPPRNRMNFNSAFESTQYHRSGDQFDAWDPRRPSVREDLTGTPTLEPQNYPFLYNQERSTLRVMNPDASRPTSIASKAPKTPRTPRYPSGEGLLPPARTYRAASAPHVTVTRPSDSEDHPLPNNAAGIILGKKNATSRLRTGSAATALRSHPPTAFANHPSDQPLPPLKNPFSDDAALAPPNASNGMYSRFSAATSASGDIGDERRESRHHSLFPGKGFRAARGKSDPFDLDDPDILGWQEEEKKQQETRTEVRRPSFAFWSKGR